MDSIVGLFNSCRSAVVDLFGLPARQLTNAMDDFDEVWLADLFCDQPGSIDGLR